MTAHQEPAYRARQIFQAIYKRGAVSAQQMPELPKTLREKIAHDFPAPPAEKIQLQKSHDGTLKLLSKLVDGRLIETVLIPSSDRNTVCVSSQVGCAYDCAFCASGRAGFERNLTPGEIVQQVLMIERELAAVGGRVSNVVFMGMGEPMANYDNVLKAVRILNNPDGLKIGARKITISTVGLVPMIQRLTGEGLQVELAISLHAPNDPLRRRLMPVNAKYPLSQLIPAVRAYIEATGRVVTFEYILIDGVNDGPKEARELAALLKGVHAKVNLIPCHPTPCTPWNRPPEERMRVFERILKENGVRCTLRKSRGLDIDGACGQLRLRRLQGIQSH
ncbi:MAG: 23S rRNA (adenine(2503)-C(2))-methyltransferase RlmN [Candidatus Omnitrophica bacterium]|nr:23S rRNA (adenine(2503)-C(2))-methyltransferase RlmN [Candidatus Omnitrophota bacterium]